MAKRCFSSWRRDIFDYFYTENLDFVKTYRYVREDGVFRKYQSKSYNLVFKLLFPYYHTKDVNSKPKIFKKSVLNKINLKSNGWFIDTEIFIKVNFYNFKFTEIPTEFKKLQTRKSLVSISSIFELFFLLLIYRFYFFFKK